MDGFRIPSLVMAILACGGTGNALNLHRGLVEEWSIRTGGEPRSLNVEWIDSAAGEGGTTDWTARLALWQGMKVEYDTAVLRVFDLAYLVDSGAYRPGRHGAWLKPSCLMPFQRDDLDSVIGVFGSRIAQGKFWSKSYFPVINRLLPGAMAEFCNGRIKEEREVARGNGKTVCFQGYASEEVNCRPAPLYRLAPGRGVVAWRSLLRQEDWRLLRFDGREVDHPPGHLLAKLHSGESWIWRRGDGADPLLWRMTVLERLDDSAGIPGWSVEVEKRDGKGGSSRAATSLRIDTVQRWVGLGPESAYPWAPYAPSMETRFALGFLADWGASGTDTMTLVEDGLTTRVWDQNSRLTSWTLAAVRGLGTLVIHSREVVGSPPSSTTTDLSWVLHSHTTEPVLIGQTPEIPVFSRNVRAFCAAHPGILLRRASLDGRVESARGGDAIRLLERRGVAVLVVGEGPGRRVIRSVVP